MTWSVGNIGTAAFANNADITPTNPTNSAGNILLGLGFFRNKTAAEGELITETAGWSQVIDSIGIGLFGVTAGVSEGNPTFQFASGSAGDSTGGVVIQTTGGTLVVEDSAISDNASSTNITFPALTIATDNCLILDIAITNDNTNFIGTGGDWTEIIDDGTIAGNDMQIGVQYQIQTTATNISSHVATIGLSTASQTLSIALRASTTTAAVLRRRLH